jgi:hypothetical protein
MREELASSVAPAAQNESKGQKYEDENMRNRFRSAGVRSGLRAR